MDACSSVKTTAARPEAFFFKENTMWYFAWILGVGFAVLLAVLNAMWGENAPARAEARERSE